MAPPIRPPSGEFIALTDRYLAGELDEAALRRWETLFLADPAARRHYAELAKTEALLPLALAATSARRRTARLIRWVAPALGLAAAVAVAVWVGIPGKPHGAMLTASLNARWEAGPATPGDLLPDTMTLREGFAEVRLPSGTSVLIEAPTHLTVTGDNALRLHAGAVVAEVPPAATGFAVETDRLRATDVGTRFGVRVPPAGGETLVGVLRGEIRVAQAGKSLPLFTGDALKSTPDGPQTVPLDRAAFPESMPEREFVWRPGGGAHDVFDVTRLISGPGDYRVVVKWTGGPWPLRASRVTLRHDGVAMASRATPLATGVVAATHDNCFTLTVAPDAPRGGRWELLVESDARNRGEGLVAFERDATAGTDPAAFLGRWTYSHDGLPYVREFLPDGRFRLYRDGVPMTALAGARYRVKDGLLWLDDVAGGPPEAHLLRGDGVLVFVNRPYRHAKREVSPPPAGR